MAKKQNLYLLHLDRALKKQFTLHVLLVIAAGKNNVKDICNNVPARPSRTQDAIRHLFKHNVIVYFDGVYSISPEYAFMIREWYGVYARMFNLTTRI